MSKKVYATVMVSIDIEDVYSDEQYNRMKSCIESFMGEKALERIAQGHGCIDDVDITDIEDIDE